MPFPLDQQVKILRRHLRVAQRALDFEVRTGRCHPIVAREDMAGLRDCLATLEGLQRAAEYGRGLERCIQAQRAAERRADTTGAN